MSRASMIVFCMLSIAAVMTTAIPIHAEVVAYPASPGLPTSTEITGLTVNGTAVPVQILGQGVDNTNMVNMANFSCSGSLTVEITAAATITSSIIRPKRLGIVGTRNGNKLTFTLPGPQKLLIEINGYHHFCFFANPLEVNPPQQGAAGVTYYGPGAANPGTITLSSNQTVYIAGGAVVTARISGSSVQNVKVVGRGILQGSVRVTGATNMVFDGIIVYNTGSSWTNTLTECNHSAYRNVKVISFPIPWGTDGINPVACTYFAIDDCFIRTGDDCIAIKSWPSTRQSTDSITVTNCISAGIGNNDGTTLGYELETAEVKNVLVKNCDFLYSRGGGATGGHSGFSVICDGPATVSNIRFEDIRCEEHVEVRSLELIVTHGTMWGSSTAGQIGHINGVYIKNCSWDNTSTPLKITGYDATHMVENVTFDHCTVGGKPLKSTADANFDINQFTRNILFINEPGVYTSVRITPAMAAVRPSGTQQFVATAVDQYGVAMPTQPASFTWSISGGGTISSSGLFTAGAAEGGPFTVTAQATVGSTTGRGTGSVIVASQQPGLNYSYYEGAWSAVPDFNAMTPVKTGIVPNFDISVANRTDNFGMSFWGYIRIPAAGQYTFYLLSDDGSKLYIDGQQVVNADGAHPAGAGDERSGTVTLTAGSHQIKVDYFEGSMDNSLTVRWASAATSIAKQPIPDNALFTTDAATVLRTASAGWATMPSLTAGVNGGVAQIRINRPGTHTVRIMDLSGAIVRSFSATGSRTYELDPAATSRGVYIIDAIIDGSRVNRRLIAR